MELQSFSAFITIIICVVISILSYSKRSGGIKGRRGKSQNQMDVEEIDRNIMKMDSVGVRGLLSPEELADENNYVSRYADNAYIQNNTKLISHEISILTPTFNSLNFVEFAQDIFRKLVSEGRASLGSLVSGKVDMTQIPPRLDRFDVCYLHNYIVENGYESIKVLITINGGSADEKYFMVFKRQNPAISVTKGEPIAISCPNCGGNITFAAKHMITTCPYCSNTVTFAEYDWQLAGVEHITADTEISNRAVIKR